MREYIIIRTSSGYINTFSPDKIDFTKVKDEAVLFPYDITKEEKIGIFELLVDKYDICEFVCEIVII